MPSSIFLDFHLPNAPTWFYFSLFLTVALFYQFGRLLALRNWDLLALFLFVPGFLLIQEGNQLAAGLPAPPDPGEWDLSDRSVRDRIIGYAWLLGASGFWFVRCLLDLAAARRPLITPNLNAPGLAWFGGALFLCLTAVAFTRPDDPWEPVGKRPAALTGLEAGATTVVSHNAARSADEVRFGVARSFAMICHGAVVAALLLIGYRLFHDLATGVAAATIYLLIPYTAFHIGQVHHVWPAALVLWAVYAYRYPAVAGGLIGLAAGTAFFPALLVPAWAQFYRGKGAGRFLGGAAVAGAVGAAVTVAALTVAGPYADGIWRTQNVSDWLPWQRASAESIWVGAHWAYRLPVFIAYAGFVLTTAIWPPVRNLGHLIAVSAAVLIGIQFWFADRGGLYVLWYAPLVVLVVLRPNLADLQPAPPRPFPRFFGRIARWLAGRVRVPRPTLPAGLSVR